ncbi:methyltransferase domain-containing protein [Rarobacter incanus]|uniref:Ubiquinone/menaquinone biosynthesis C-methylase UbiE n=1 Tax=Rarobacter incanus TaxID=153494 RepID=A0A542SRP0_9MICO|nr:methyltransferase domain-containing protein [Rarobacter incanus]TQK77272.1 ubiquinone/menaquinone biosynthesis C-methylase UbiE [Rarobacter incanus]
MSTDAPLPPAAHANLAQESESYTHGHAESVLRSHRWRTAENSARYLRDRLAPGMSLLDVGCGPGTLTVDLARIVSPGRVVGVDAAQAVLEAAREHAAREDVPVDFEAANVYELPFADAQFDVVHVHQLLQHLSDPVAAIRELRRVVKPGGIVAARESDYGAMTWFPQYAGLTEWNLLYHEVTAAHGFEADAGRRLLGWFLQAGYAPAQLTPSSSTWCYATPALREWWGDLWAQRCLESNFAIQAREAGLADDVALEALAHDWHRWAADDAGWFSVLHGEVIAQ